MIIPVSVIIPAYNPGPFLDEALESVTRQTVAPCETIVIDDGSSPPIILPEHVKTTVRLVRQQNTGQAEARNNAIRMATGDWVAFLDADDLWHPRKLELQWQAAQRSPASAIIGCRSVLIDAEGHGIGLGPGKFTAQSISLSRKEFIAQAALAIMVPSMTLVKKSAIQGSGNFDSRYQPIEDLVFFDRLFASGAVCTMLEIPLLKRRIHGSSLTLRYREMLRSYLRWEKEIVRPQLGETIGQMLRSSAYLVTGLSALAKNEPWMARTLLKRAMHLGRFSSALLPFFLTFLGSRITSEFRSLKRFVTKSHAETAWAASLRTA